MPSARSGSVSPGGGGLPLSEAAPESHCRMAEYSGQGSWAAALRRRSCGGSNQREESSEGFSSLAIHRTRARPPLVSISAPQTRLRRSIRGSQALPFSRASTTDMLSHKNRCRFS